VGYNFLVPKTVTHKRTSVKAFRQAQELRHNQTPAEAKLWARLRNHQLNGPGFRRQHAISPSIVDYCCPACKATIELDGDSHADQETYDQQRTEWLLEQGHFFCPVLLGHHIEFSFI
jgi:very-short-patch-repair endonuclease